MNEPALDAVIQRLKYLERQNRWWKFAGVTIVAGVAAVILMGQAMPRKLTKIIEAEQFIIRDRTGSVRASLAVEEDGWLRLNLNDAAGKRRASVLVTPDGTPSMVLRDHTETARALLGLTADGSPGLAFTDQTRRVIWSAPTQATK